MEVLGITRQAALSILHKIMYAQTKPDGRLDLRRSATVRLSPKESAQLYGLLRARVEGE